MPASGAPGAGSWSEAASSQEGPVRASGAEVRLLRCQLVLHRGKHLLPFFSAEHDRPPHGLCQGQRWAKAGERQGPTGTTCPQRDPGAPLASGPAERCPRPHTGISTCITNVPALTRAHLSPHIPAVSGVACKSLLVSQPHSPAPSPCHCCSDPAWLPVKSKCYPRACSSWEGSDKLGSERTAHWALCTNICRSHSYNTAGGSSSALNCI